MAVTYRGWRVIAVLVTVAILVTGLVKLGRTLVKNPRDELVDGKTGSWWFPRGGPYILGFWSPSPASLEIDGEKVAEGQGFTSRRVVYESGVHSVTFKAPPSARLLWHPPGRRGAIEYVSSSSLSKDPAERAYFTAPGTDHELAGVAFAILAVVAFGLMKLARPFEDGRISGPGVLIFVVAMGARAWSLGDTGQTWDEDEYWSAGRNYVSNIFEGDTSDTAWSFNQQHPPVTKYLAGVGALAEDGYFAARLLFCAFGAGACVLIFAVGRRLFGGRAGFLAGMIAALLPHLIAHGRIVGHETPSFFFWTLSVWLALSSADDQERPLWQALKLVLTGVAFGLAVGTRFPNLLVAPVIGVAALAYTKRETLIRTALAGLVIVPIIAAATIVAIWPLLWHDALPHLRGAWSVLNTQHLPEMFLGREEQRPPWQYFPAYLLATTPVVILVCALVLGTVRGAVRRELRPYLILVAWLALPFGMAFSPVRQDGMRYILPVLAPIAILAGAGLDWVMIYARRVAFLLGLIVLAYLANIDRRVSPYYLDYYNEAVGGPRNVQEKRLFEVGWWGEGLGEAVEWLNDRARHEAVVARLVEPIHVTWFRGDLWKNLADRVKPDTEWLLVNDEWLESDAHDKWAPPLDFRLVHDVRVMGASFVRVYQRTLPGGDAR